MKKKIIVSVFVFIVVIVLTLGISSVIIGKLKAHHTDSIYVTSSDWVNEVGAVACGELVKGIPELKYSIEGNKGGIIVDFYYKNYDKLDKEKKVVLKDKMRKLSRAFAFSLVSYGIENDNANCIINVRANKSDKPKLSLINNDIVFF